METLTVAALLCAVMSLTSAAALPEEMPGQEAAERHLVKRATVCCPGWSPANGRCFRYIRWPMTWTGAEKRCQALGGNLASVHNIQEYRAIQNLIIRATQRYTPAWIGGSDAQEEKKWLWTDGSPFDYVRWSPGEPNNRLKQHCIRMNHAGGYAWDDMQCWLRAPSVCAKRT